MKTYDVALPKAKRGLGDIDYRRRLAQQLMSQGTDTSPVGHWTQAAARIAQAISGSLNQDQAESQDAALQADANAALMQMLPSMTGGSSSAGAPPQAAVATASQPVQPLSDEELGVAKFAAPGLAQSVPKVASALAPQDMRGAPAAIRHNNPGAMWPGPSSKKFGATGFQTIGGGNKIATFPDATSGAAAQFDLLSRSYAGMPLNAAIRKWSGGNSSPQYVAKIAQSLGVAPNTVLTPQMLQDPAVAVPLAKTMAQWESGKPFPLDDQKWNEAHKMALGGPTQAETAAAQPQQMQVADASGSPDRATIERLLSNPYTRDMALKLIQQQMAPKDSGPASVEEFKFYEGLSPERRQVFDRLKRDGFKDVGNGFINPATGQFVPKNIAEKEIQAGYGKDVAKTRAELPEAKLRLDMVTDNLSRLKQQAQSVLASPGLEKVAGGLYQKYVPNVTGPALNTETDLENLKVKISGVVLQSMRDMSKTGGAVGQVTEREWPRLENMIANLDTKQDLPQFKQRLQEVFNYADAVTRQMNEAYQADLQKAQMAPADMPTPVQAPRPRPDIKSKYRDLE